MKPDDVLKCDGSTSKPYTAKLSLRNPPDGFPYQVAVSVSPVTNIITCTWRHRVNGPMLQPEVKLTVEHKRETVDTVSVSTAKAAKEVAKQWLCHAAKAHRFAQDTLEELRSL